MGSIWLDCEFQLRETEFRPIPKVVCPDCEQQCSKLVVSQQLHASCPLCFIRRGDRNPLFAVRAEHHNGYTEMAAQQVIQDAIQDGR